MIRFFLIVCLYCVSSSAQINTFRIFPGPMTQTEPVVDLNPLYPDLLFVSAVTINTADLFKSEGIYVSTDGGSTWFGSDTCKGAYIGNHGGDPWVAVTNSRNLVFTHTGSLFPGIYSHYSQDLGLTWSGAIAITTIVADDKGTTTIDHSPASPYYDRVYAAWVSAVNPFPVNVSYTTDEGHTWSALLKINPVPPSRCSGGSIKTSSDGKVYIAWGGLTANSPFTEDYVGFAKSTDGGASWNITQNIFDVNGVNGILPQKNNIIINGLPQMAVDKSGGIYNGRIYIVTTEKDLPPAGTDQDVILRYSDDFGTTWSGGIRVNQDQINNSKIQYFPAITVDDLGGLNIIYYDDRNTASDSSEIFLARSTDGGNSWFETPISGHRFQPKPIIGGSSYYQGDHISVITSGSKLHAFWMDDYSGIYQVWTSIIDLTKLDQKDNSAYTPEFYLEQNYPNPFNPETNIKFSVPAELNVQLKLFNLLGEEIAELVNGGKSSGIYNIRLNSDAYNLSSGVYIYRLTAGSYSASRKLILIR